MSKNDMTSLEKDEDFSAYYDNRLDPDERVRFERLLANSPEMQTAYDEFAATVDQLSHVTSQRAPIDFVQQVTSTIQQRSDGRFFHERSFRVPYEVFAALVLVLIGAIYVMGQAGSIEIDDDPPVDGTIVIYVDTAIKLDVLEQSLTMAGFVSAGSATHLDIEVGVDSYPALLRAIESIPDTNPAATERPAGVTRLRVRILRRSR